jgi:predicted small lipoprotein YifL
MKPATTRIAAAAIATVALATAALGLAACGQKGPLYLPQPAAQPVARPGDDATRKVPARPDPAAAQ